MGRRLRVLSALDTAKIQYYHFRAIIIAGMGLFTDAYDFFCIPPIMNLIGHVYYPHHHSQAPTALVSALVALALLGAAIGQPIFGFLGDRIGRRRVYSAVLILMMLCSLACGFSVCTTRGCVLGSLGFFRFALGVGIGGDYPLSATIMSEFSNQRTRGAFIAAVFSMQGFGILASSAVTMAVCAAFQLAYGESPTGKTPQAADLAWRVILMAGAVPAALTFYWRIKMPETARYTALVEENVAQAAKDMEKVLGDAMPPIPEDEEESQVALEPFNANPSPPFLRRHGLHLFACAATWFLLDVVFYSNNLFYSQIYQDHLRDKEPNLTAFQEAFHVAKIQAIVAASSTIPGYLATVYFIDRVGRRPIQIAGFLALAVLFSILGAMYRRLSCTNAGFILLYGLTFFFANFGPNTTTFIVPAELFPARLRTTCHGLSGAAGKLGAIVGAVGFQWATQRKEKKGEHLCPRRMEMTVAMVVLGGICVVGMGVTYFFTPETMGRSLEENENDDGEAEPSSLIGVGRPTSFRRSNSGVVRPQS
ncbi:probable inorganic phosphate transporter 1-9 [Malania oleifera]|uniref:probable inorganic phosphate transporter 1-9 n=1 Tax=Malania oleifera TaxID=397392 RepID=UPI0025AE3ACF|nr:probable inorganic phosphate transporter 1-9 [Malania oleifera]